MPQKPFEIPYAREHSIFWRATEERLGNIAAFFRKLQPFHLADAPGGNAQHHDRRSSDDPRQTGLRRKLRRLSFEQTAAAGIDPQSGEGKSWFARRGDEAGFSREQFPLQRKALSGNAR